MARAELGASIWTDLTVAVITALAAVPLLKLGVGSACLKTAEEEAVQR